MDTTLKWFEIYRNVTALGRYLVEQGVNAKELQAFYEKPWKYDDEWEQMKSN